MTKDLTQERVRELLDYDYENGGFIRKFKSGLRKPCGHKQHSCHGYGYVGIDGKMYRTHRVIWLWHKGEWPDGEIDHINQNKMDNRIENLRVVSSSENSHNIGLSSRNTSGFTGVSLDKQRNKYRAQIMNNNKLIHIGYFNTAEEAFEAYKRAKIKYHPTSPDAQLYRQELGMVA